LEARLQGRVAQPPRVTLTSLRKLYDLLDDGIRKVRSGITTLDEVLRVTA